MSRSIVVIAVVFACSFFSYVSFHSSGLDEPRGAEEYTFLQKTQTKIDGTARLEAVAKMLKRVDKDVGLKGRVPSSSSFYGHTSSVDMKVITPYLLSSPMLNANSTQDKGNNIDNNNEEPETGSLSLNLAFVHMRKAGGTHLLSIFDQVLRQHNCTDATEIVGTSGVQAGIPLDMLRKRNYTNVKVKCPNVNMIHIEMTCMQGDEIIRLPKRDEMRNKHFSLFTTLRDPIERIGSQANYGKHSVGFIVMNDYLQMYCSQFYKKAVENFVYENILCTANPQWQQCKCYREALSRAKNNIATNESVWFKWIHGTTGFDDRYMPNYYTKRLVGSFNEFSKKMNKKTSNSINCFNQGQCFAGNGYVTMSNILKTNDFCPLYYDKNETVIALNMAKKLLRNHYDFILQERFNDTACLAALKQALHINVTLDSGSMGRVDNQGMTTGARDTNHRRLLPSSLASLSLSPSSSSYRNSIPPNALKYLQGDNAADIELYNFAVDEFDRRSKREGWGKI